MSQTRSIGGLILLAFVVLTAIPLAEVLAQVSFNDLEFKSENELLSLMEQSVPEDQARIYTALARQIMDRDPQQSRKHLQSADALSAPQDFAGRGYLEANWCWLNIIFADLSKASQKCASAVEFAERSDNAWALTKAYGTASVLHYQMGALNDAYEVGLKAIEAAMAVGRVTVLATQYNAMGLITRAQGRFQTALDYFARGLALLDPQRHEEIYRTMSFNVGIAYSDLGQHDIAQDYYAGSLAWAVETRRYAKEITALTYIAIADNALGRPQKVVDELSRALQRPELRDNHGYLAFAYAVLGEAYLQLQDREAALQAFQRGMQIVQADPNTFEQRRVAIGYAQALYESGDVAQARDILTSSIDRLRTENARTMLLSALNLLGELEESQGNYAAALAANKKPPNSPRTSSNKRLKTSWL